MKLNEKGWPKDGKNDSKCSEPVPDTSGVNTSDIILESGKSAGKAADVKLTACDAKNPKRNACF